MVNLVAAQKSLTNWMMKMVGLTTQAVEISEETVMNFWVPTDKGRNKKENKPAVVLLHGFFTDGAVTWQFQVGSLTAKYAVYVPDLLFFGGSVTSSTDRSPNFQAECLAKALAKLGVERCAIVGFSYGGVVAFKLAELEPHLVACLAVSGSLIAMTDSIIGPMLDRLGFSSVWELLLPSSVKGLKDLLSVGAHKKLWLPDRYYRDFLEVMFTNRKEKGELLESLVISNNGVTIPKFQQSILLLWGENDQIFNLELGKNMREQLGDNATLQTIGKAGHLVHLEQPCIYNKCLNKFLSLSLQPDDDR